MALRPYTPARWSARSASIASDPPIRLVGPGQFVSLAFGQQARAAGIAQSMGSRGGCFDNAVAESFFATLKNDDISADASDQC